MSEIINALKKVITEFDPITVPRYKAECILQVINKYYVKRKEITEHEGALRHVENRLAEVKTEVEQANIMVEDCLARLTKTEAERDSLKSTYAKANEHFSDAWGLSVDYDGFNEPDNLKGLIDDIILNMNLGRKVMRETMEASGEKA